MHARSHRSIEPYDASVRPLRAYVDQLLRGSCSIDGPVCSYEQEAGDGDLARGRTSLGPPGSPPLSAPRRGGCAYEGGA
jgi:hypothetical protein